MLFDFPALLHLQLEAILMVSRHRRIQVLIPMVTFTEEIVRIRQALEKLAAKKRMAPPPVGAMVETPAAALAVSSLRKQAHFLGIGTNDLTQYVMAADRESALVRDYFNESHPVMIELLRSIVVHAGKTPITLCGELAVKRDSLARVLKTGITALSIAPNSIPAIKEAIRHIDM
jgi:phosphoenolpyruvate-protein kinase (PTS system EI component)